MAAEHPFAVLQIEPTMDMAVVKRAYFAALALHPPHSDPAGFRRLRAAYEALTATGGLAAAYLSSPVNVVDELERRQERFAAVMVEAMAARRETESRARTIECFVDMLSRRRFDEIALS
ncbi:MAG: hypothetical protein V2A73_20660 [Pseudomonadota bacterium]